MFTLDLSDTFWWPVTFSVPGDGGKYVKHAFEVEFKRLSTEQLQELRDRVRAENLRDDQVAAELIQDWRGVVDREGNPIAYTPAHVKRALGVSGLGSAVVAAYHRAVTEAPAKN